MRDSGGRQTASEVRGTARGRVGEVGLVGPLLEFDQIVDIPDGWLANRKIENSNCSLRRRRWQFSADEQQPQRAAIECDKTGGEFAFPTVSVKSKRKRGWMPANTARPGRLTLCWPV